MATSQIVVEHDALVKETLSGRNPSTSPKILNSWRRCVEHYGLDPKDTTDPAVLTREELRVREDRLRDLIQIAESEMQTLHQQVAGSSDYSIILTDHEGTILRCLCETGFDTTSRRDGLQVGGLWGEAYQGTNGMGTCLVEQRPVVIQRDEHFLAKHTGLTCSAAPIVSPNGSLLGVLDASSASHHAQQHTMSLVDVSAHLIENRLFLKQHENDFVLRFHSRIEFVTSPGEGMLTINAEGRITNANRSALKQLGCDQLDQLLGHHVENVFETQLEELCFGPRLNGQHPQPLREVQHGRLFFAVVQRPRAFKDAGNDAWISFSDQAEIPTQQAGRAALPSSGGPLEKLHFKDPAMAYNIRCAQRILDEDIPLLLQGETGTGKEVFSKAVHDASSRADQPFVAVNCASIPETLIESELFGYQPGAFTGANRKGQRGKILEADGGTLFLDEIGDMPISLQARLLRVLETREVLPLGGNSSIKVDIRIISATHRCLRDLIQQGEFREDLYYRLNGLALRLPSLHERSDKRRLISALIRQEMPADRQVEIDESARQLLYDYHWPGNIRQLRYALRTALVLADDVMRSEHLPLEVRQGSATTGYAEFADSERPGNANPLEAAERLALLELLERYRWNISQVARHLHVCRNTLYRKMRRHDIKMP